MSDSHNVLVGGGTSGINLAIALAYARAGSRVAVLSRSQDKVDAAIEQLSALGPEARGYAADVRDYAAVDHAVADTAAAWGPLDVVISGAAGNFVAPAGELSSNGFRAVMDIDLLGTFHVARASWPHLRKPGASLISITASQAWLPTPGQAHVGAAKAGVDQLTRTLAIEWGAAGVRVNAVAPGPIADTEGMRRLAPTPEALEAWTRAVPLGRMGQLQDVCDAVLWLTSPQASYVTGVVLSVDGGLALGGSSAMAAAMS
jgi:NAD(P)-dependent dehydrogenase (short-subunit alcohol dehydrogenase family)